MPNSNPINLTAPAKLNLFLHITGRRENGYHELQTVFQLLNFGDELEFERRDDGELRLTVSGTGDLDELETEDNLVYRAARLIREEAGNPDLGADIKLTKRLPAGGGVAEEAPMPRPPSSDSTHSGSQSQR